MLGLLLAAAALPAAGQSSPNGAATLEIRETLAVGAMRPGAPRGGSGRRGAAVAGLRVYRITGDPNRAYRVSLTQGWAGALEGAAIVSDTAGDITLTRLARLNARGEDTLRIRLASPGGDAGARPTLSIGYE